MLQKKDVAADERGGFAASIAKLTELVSKGSPAKWRFSRRCRGGEHTAQEAWSCNRSLGND